MTHGRVLIVDDNAMNIELVAFVLGAEGFVVESAQDAGKALGRISLAIPDLILMDIQMPGMSGIDLTRQLKADPATKHIPIVALTAYAMKGDEVKLRAAGCDGYMSKPIDVATFAQRVGAFLAARNLFEPMRSEPYT
jgi:two-component system cell cycle response regulator DivK